MKEKEPIKLRKKPMKEGGFSLYLDTYINGKRSYEFLKLYLVEERARVDKERNKNTMMLANAVKAKRLVELQNGRFGFEDREKCGKYPFFAYFKRFSATKNTKGKNYYDATLKHLTTHETRQNIQLAEITPSWMERFKKHLENCTSTKTGRKLNQNSIRAYYDCVVFCLHQAVKDGLLPSNPALKISPPKHETTERVYLTIDELKRLSATPYKRKNICNAFLFSCTTGLRISDIYKLRWSDVHDNGTRLVFRQKKTKRLEYLDISSQARRFMGACPDPNALVFDLPALNLINHHLQKWVDLAGIKKKVTFHCGRHTFATMMLTLGADLYTTSKLLGHSSVQTTQIYAKIIDEKKRKAVELIPKL